MIYVLALAYGGYTSPFSGVRVCLLRGAGLVGVFPFVMFVLLVPLLIVTGGCLIVCRTFLFVRGLPCITLSFAVNIDTILFRVEVCSNFLFTYVLFGLARRANSPATLDLFVLLPLGRRTNQPCYVYVYLQVYG